MIDAILDTNILIYLSKKSSPYLRFFKEELKGKQIGISVVSFVEFLIGAETKLEQAILRESLSSFEIFPLTTEIGFQCAMTLSKREKPSFKNPKIADIIIAQTALFHGVPLVTNNAKDFRSFRGLKLIVP